MNGEQLRVFVDGVVVWDVRIGAFDFVGPVGMRSDNARLEMELGVGGSSGLHPDYVLGCKAGADAGWSLTREVREFVEDERGGFEIGIADPGGLDDEVDQSGPAEVGAAFGPRFEIDLLIGS